MRRWLTHANIDGRDPEDDFGDDDLLMRYYAEDHLPYVKTGLQSSAPR